MPTTNRIPQATLDADRATVRGLSDLGDYTAVNSAYSLAALQALEAALDQAEEAEVRARRMLDQARKQATMAAHTLHDAVIGAKAQVIAQYGPDSWVVKQIGLKRKSDYRRPTRRRATPPA